MNILPGQGRADYILEVIPLVWIWELFRWLLHCEIQRTFQNWFLRPYMSWNTVLSSSYEPCYY